MRCFHAWIFNYEFRAFDLSVTSYIHHFFVVKELKILSCKNFEVFPAPLLIRVALHCAVEYKKSLSYCNLVLPDKLISPHPPFAHPS